MASQWSTFGGRTDLGSAHLCSFKVDKLNIKYNRQAKRVVQFDFEKGTVTNQEKDAKSKELKMAALHEVVESSRPLTVTVHFRAISKSQQGVSWDLTFQNEADFATAKYLFRCVEEDKEWSAVVRDADGVHCLETRILKAGIIARLGKRGVKPRLVVVCPGKLFIFKQNPVGSYVRFVSNLIGAAVSRDGENINVQTNGGKLIALTSFDGEMGEWESALMEAASAKPLTKEPAKPPPPPPAEPKPPPPGAEEVAKEARRRASSAVALETTIEAEAEAAAKAQADMEAAREAEERAKAEAEALAKAEAEAKEAEAKEAAEAARKEAEEEAKALEAARKEAEEEAAFARQEEERAIRTAMDEGIGLTISAGDDKMAEYWRKWKERKGEKPVKEQAEYFLYKFNAHTGHADITRTVVTDLVVEYSRFDDRKVGILESDQAMRLLEARNETKTYTELVELLKSIDADMDGKISFLEFACSVFRKSWTDLHAEIEVAVQRTQAMSIAEKEESQVLEQKQAFSRARQASVAIRNQKEEAERLRLEREKELTGVAASKAFFARQAEEASKTTEAKAQANAEEIRHDYAKRKEEKQIEKDKKAAEEARAKAEAEAIATAEAEAKRLEEERRIAYEEEKRREEEETAARLMKEKEERAERRAKFAAERAKMFEGGGN